MQFISVEYPASLEAVRQLLKVIKKNQKENKSDF